MSCNRPCGMVLAGPPHEHERRGDDLTEALLPRRVGVGQLVPYGREHGLVVVDRPVGRHVGARRSRERRRGLHQHQPLHPVRVRLREQMGDDAAHAVADQADPVELARVEEAEEVVEHQLEVVLVGPVALAVTAQVEGVHPPFLTEQTPGRLPARGGIAEAVQQHDGRAERVAPGPVRQTYVADIHNRLIIHTHDATAE